MSWSPDSHHANDYGIRSKWRLQTWRLQSHHHNSTSTLPSVSLTHSGVPFISPMFINPRICSSEATQMAQWWESVCWCRRCGFDPWVGKIPWRRKCQPTQAFLPGKSHEQRRLVGYTPCVSKSLSKHTHLFNQIENPLYTRRCCKWILNHQVMNLKCFILQQIVLEMEVETALHIYQYV